MCAYYYLDIETVPLEPFDGKHHWSNDPTKSKIISIQFQPLDWITGKPLGELSILKEWESSERIIVKRFKKIYQIDNQWGFIPVGNNLAYEFRFLECKFAQYCRVDGLKLSYRPSIDLNSILVMHNKGYFKGSTLAIGKVGLSQHMPEWYDKKNFRAIEEYIREAQRFVEAHHRLKMILPEIRLS